MDEAAEKLEEATAAVRKMGPFDRIIGSDLLYAPESFPELLETLAALCTPEHTQVLLAYPVRFTEPIFLEQAEEMGFEQLGWPEEVEPSIFAARLVLRDSSEG